mmetsp:Transcript_16819/g.24352  ORF Transcript_16819/g.24352 Transcript_16819/m.24352 type:complete len:83 (+) Transcript_16819:530-778(+)
MYPLTSKDESVRPYPMAPTSKAMRQVQLLMDGNSRPKNRKSAIEMQSGVEKRNNMKVSTVANSKDFMFKNIVARNMRDTGRN